MTPKSTHPSSLKSILEIYHRLLAPPSLANEKSTLTKLGIWANPKDVSFHFQNFVRQVKHFVRHQIRLLTQSPSQKWSLCCFCCSKNGGKTVVLLSDSLETDLLSCDLFPSGNIRENRHFVRFFDVKGNGCCRQSCSNSLRGTHPYAGTLSSNFVDHRTLLFRLCTTLSTKLHSSPKCSSKAPRVDSKYMVPTNSLLIKLHNIRLQMQRGHHFWHSCGSKSMT